MSIGTYFRLLCGLCGACDCLPNLESLLQLLSICGRSKPMPARTEVLGDGPIGGEESLGMTRGLESLHAPLALPRGLVGVLSAVIEIPVLEMWFCRKVDSNTLLSTISGVFRARTFQYMV